MKIGNFETENNVFLAPMAGVTDLPFRKICRRYGAGLVYSEMVSAKAESFEVGLLKSSSQKPRPKRAERVIDL